MKSLDRLILQSVATDAGSMSAAVAKGWSYSQILDGVARLQSVGLMSRIDGKLHLTATGRAALEAADQRTFPRARISTRVERLRPTSVYVPSEAALVEIRESVSTTGKK